jgi:hypothetical protein
VRKLVMLAMAAVVALLIVVPTAMAQLPTTGGQAELPTTGGQAELPTTGGPSPLLLPAAALLLSSGVVVGYAALRRR